MKTFLMSMIVTLALLLGGCGGSSPLYNGDYPDTTYLQINSSPGMLKDAFVFTEITVDSDSINMALQGFNLETGDLANTIPLEVLRNPLTLQECQQHLINSFTLEWYTNSSITNKECYLGQIGEGIPLIVMFSTITEDEKQYRDIRFMVIFGRVEDDDKAAMAQILGVYEVEMWSTFVEVVAP